jgi:hypothetical protein
MFYPSNNKFKEPVEKKPKIEEISRIGEFVKVLQGRHQGLIGEIIQIKEKKDGVAAKIKLLDFSEARVWLDEVVTVSKEEVNKVLNKDMEITGWVRPRIRIVSLLYNSRKSLVSLLKMVLIMVKRVWFKMYYLRMNVLLRLNLAIYWSM